MSEFIPFPKLSRWSRDIVITEKLDGTNASIFIEKVLASVGTTGFNVATHTLCTSAPFVEYGMHFQLHLSAGSRTRWVTPTDDNYGFAKWVQAHATALFALGEGHHFGEWWGQGIQRTYSQPVKRFSLFNSGRWSDGTEVLEEGMSRVPECCNVVPVLYKGPNEQSAINKALNDLAGGGSWAAPGFMDPEGIVIYHSASGTQFKKTVKKDESPKGMFKKAA